MSTADPDPEALFMDRLNRVGPLVRRAYVTASKDPAHAEVDIRAAIARLQEALFFLANTPRPSSSAGAAAVIDDEVT